MTTLIFHALQLVQKASIRTGLGAFPIQDGYKCIECHNLAVPEHELCLACRKAWISEAGHIELTDTFERKMNFAVGGAACVQSLGAWGVNRLAGLWEEGGAVRTLTYFVPELTASSVFHTVLLAAFGLLFLVGVTVVTALMCVSSFMLCMNPKSKRHWKHLTPRAWLLMILMLMAEIWIVVLGSRIMELLLVILPGLLGVVGLVMPFCMLREEEVGGLDGEEKMVKD